MSSLRTSPSAVRRLARLALLVLLALGAGSAARLALPAAAATAGSAGAEGEAHEGVFLLHYIPGLERVPAHVLGAIFVALVLAALAWVGTRELRRGEAGLVPSERLTVQNFLELMVETTVGFLESIIGHQGRRFLPLIGTLAFFILFANLLGQIPGFLPPTSHLGTTAALAAVVFVTTHYVGIKANGVAYVKHFLGPIWWLAPLMLVIEIISHLARPLSLSVRLFGNMFGDHMVLALFVGLVPLVVPVPAMILGVFVALVQTFVFCLLSTMYIAGAVAHEEH
ncbi:MAG TPA: F0F1 ATP synthase subunit A [Thermodesulfobacteriota bacterium]|nr:F0F1 ATP synthase subunit A [Thermodesulfobacteriota bacterium]